MWAVRPNFPGVRRAVGNGPHPGGDLPDVPDQRFGACQSEESTVSRSLRVPIVVSAAAALSLALAAPASADQAFHTERFPLTPVAGAPLKSGAVIDIHAEGPTVYALERYHLVGAEPGTTYLVTLLVHGD